MRLIYAETLKKEFPKDEDWEYPVNTNEYVCEKIDEQTTIEQPTVAYICDRGKCGEKCSAEEGICKHTFDVRHAKNFKKISSDVFVEGDDE